LIESAIQDYRNITQPFLASLWLGKLEVPFFEEEVAKALNWILKAEEFVCRNNSRNYINFS